MRRLQGCSVVKSTVNLELFHFVFVNLHHREKLLVIPNMQSIAAHRWVEALFQGWSLEIFLAPTALSWNPSWDADLACPPYNFSLAYVLLFMFTMYQCITCEPPFGSLHVNCKQVAEQYKFKFKFLSCKVGEWLRELCTKHAQYPVYQQSVQSETTDETWFVSVWQVTKVSLLHLSLPQT